MKRTIRKLPGVSRRVETGAVQFGDDLSGLFIRGDDAMQIAVALGAIVPNAGDVEAGDYAVLAVLRSMILKDIVGEEAS